MSAGVATELIRVLTVDDSAAVRDGLTSILEASGEIELVGVATDGAEAIEAVARLAPEVVLMDTQMPVMDGADATRAIKASSPDTKMLFLLRASDASGAGPRSGRRHGGAQGRRPRGIAFGDPRVGGVAIVLPERGRPSVVAVLIKDEW